MTAYHIWLKEYLCLVAIEENNGFLTALKMRTQYAVLIIWIPSEDLVQRVTESSYMHILGIVNPIRNL